MAYTSTLISEGRGVRIAGLQFTYTATYRITSDSASVVSPLTVLAGAQSALPDPVPEQFDTYNLWSVSDSQAYAQDFDLSPEAQELPNQWLCRVTWRGLDQSNSPTDYGTDPEDRTPRYSLEFWDTQEIVSQAYNVTALTSSSTWRAANTLGPIVNTAGDQFHDALVEDDRIVVLVARKNFYSLADILTLHRTFNRTVNSDTFKGYSAHKAKFIGIDAGELVYEKGYSPYYPATIRVALRDDEWYVPIVNKGMKARPAAGQAPEVAKDANGQPVSEPVLLASDGTKLASSTTGNVLNYRTREAVAYTGGSGLGID